MNATRAEFWMTWLFRLNAAVLTSALLTVFLPNETMNSIHQKLGMGELPTDPIVEYLARSCSLLYGIHGAVLLTISLRPRKYWSLIPLVCVLHLFVAVVLLVTDLRAPMPWFWTILEGPPIFLFAGVILWLWRIASQRSE